LATQIILDGKTKVWILKQRTTH